MNNFSHQESNQVPSSTASTDSFIRRRRGAVRKQNVHEVKFPKNFQKSSKNMENRRKNRDDLLVTIKFFSLTILVTLA